MYLLGICSVQGPLLRRPWGKTGPLSHRVYHLVRELDIKTVDERLIRGSMKCEPRASGKTFQKKDAKAKVSHEALAKQERMRGWEGGKENMYKGLEVTLGSGVAGS